MNKVEKDLNKVEAQIDQDERSKNRDAILKARQNSMNKQNKTKESFNWLTEHSRNFLAAGYVPKGITPETRIREIANRAEEILGIKGYSDKFYNYMSEGFYSLSSPVWSNFGKKRGLPISCFGSNIADDMGNILYTQSEVGMMSKLGGGTSGYFGHIRHRGAAVKNNGEASGSVHIMQLFETMVDVVSQGSVRRGRFSPYLPVEHSDISEFLDIGTEGNPIQGLQYGVTVTDAWLKSMKAGSKEKRKIWAKIIQHRNEFGFPYIMFYDNSNNNTPYKDLGYKITASNLCSEIQLPTDSFNSFVCCLGSINLLHWDEIVETDAVEVYTQFLNAVMDEFIQKAEFMAGMKRAWRFAQQHRAIGVGALGYHSYLQSKLVEFESMEAKMINHSIFNTLKERTEAASRWLHDAKGYKCIREGYANTTLMAIAPRSNRTWMFGDRQSTLEISSGPLCGLPTGLI